MANSKNRKRHLQPGNLYYVWEFISFIAWEHQFTQEGKLFQGGAFWLYLRKGDVIFYLGPQEKLPYIVGRKPVHAINRFEKIYYFDSDHQIISALRCNLRKFNSQIHVSTTK